MTDSDKCCCICYKVMPEEFVMISGLKYHLSCIEELKNIIYNTRSYVSSKNCLKLNAKESVLYQMTLLKKLRGGK